MQSDAPIKLNGWTGGQYSLYRAAMGVLLAAGWVQSWWTVADGPIATGLCTVGIATSVMIVVGWFDRAAAGVCVVLGGKLLIDVEAFDMNAVVVLFVLLAHVVTPGQPYGSLAAKGRADPRGAWALPPAVVVGAWALMLVFTTAVGLSQFYEGGGMAAAALYGPIALVPLLRPFGWLAMTLVLGVLTAMSVQSPGAFDLYDLALWLVHALTFDPAWIKPKRASDNDWLFYDGDCGLCHASVRFVLAEDTSDAAFRFAPIGGDAFHETLSETQRRDLPDSVVLLTADGRLLVRSAAIVAMLGRLGGIWRVVGIVLRIVPRPVRDGGYRVVAKLRRKLFAKPSGACPMIAERDRSKFVMSIRPRD